ncbi:hypothetical protein BDP27DRAFT_1425834 [Rhodocollybia butyracea]|uniref:Uncharacterized protein n=1 Tax=Rhodocollybia butyracea TaxID=206335 RepID=A0A9P5U3C6_9AGAR|nr:hypothetical protein BDP27DRAFT_1425834 [Rhodocollybia butyracea]
MDTTGSDKSGASPAGSPIAFILKAIFQPGNTTLATSGYTSSTASSSSTTNTVIRTTSASTSTLHTLSHSSSQDPKLQVTPIKIPEISTFSTSFTMTLTTCSESEYCSLKTYQIANLNVCENTHYYELFIDNDFDNDFNNNNSQSSETNAIDAFTPKHSILSRGAIVGTVIGSLFVLAASIGIFVLVHGAQAGRCQCHSQWHDIPTKKKSQHKHNHINHHTPISQIEPNESEIRQSGLLLHSLSTLIPIQGDLDPNDMRATMETTIIGRMADHIHNLESQLAGDGISDAPPPTYVTS